MNKVMTAIAPMLMLFIGASSISFAATVTTSNGRLIVNGNPFFPFGFFANVGDPMRDLEAVGANGFNTIYCNNKCDDTYYARAAQLGVYVIHDIWWRDPKASVRSSRDKSPLIA